ALDRSSLAAHVRVRPSPESAAARKPLAPVAAPNETAAVATKDTDAGPPRSAYVVSLGAAKPVAVAAAPAAARPVPDVRGLPLRSAARALHEAGFHVSLAGSGDGTAPAAGTMLRAGSTVRLFHPRTAD
ncbi:MAG TPA: PASTA domain-containing protein, partial [Gemmatimonadaceae bacterium]|nr:PASTA domain-containing protein [Gemmatimonadaceae bacterium]